MSLEQLISHFTNPDNTIRGQAEAAFLEATARPEVLLPELLNVARTGATPAVSFLKFYSDFSFLFFFFSFSFSFYFF